MSKTQTTKTNEILEPARVAQRPDPFPPRRADFACAATVAAAGLMLYFATLAPTVTLVDSGELILAARSLGVAHPPGFPLYVLLAHLATLVPIGNIAQRVNFASALFAALAAGVLTLLVAELTAAQSLIRRKTSKSTRKPISSDARKRSRQKGTEPLESTTSPELSHRECLAAALIAGLLFASSRTIWAYATLAEVYTLNSLLILIIFYLLFRWRSAVLTQRSYSAVEILSAGGRQGKRQDRWLYAAALVFGLALGVHHVTVGLMLPAFAALVLATEGLYFFLSRRLLYAALCGFAGLCIYAYLPLAASRSPVMNWGDPRTLRHIWDHVTARQYQVFLQSSPEIMARQFGEFMSLAGREFGPGWFPAALVLAALGLAALFKRDLGAFWFLCLAVLADFAYGLKYEIAEDKDAYYLPAFVALAAAAGLGAHWLIKRFFRFQQARAATLSIASCLLLAVPAGALISNLPYNNRGKYFIAHDYVENILSTVAPGGMLLTLDWQVYSPMLYTREIENFRTDVVVIDVNQLRRSWYFDYLRRSYPSLIEQTEQQVGAYYADLTRWDENPAAYDQDATLNQRINNHFYEMIMAFIETHMRTAPVYVTLDAALQKGGPEPQLAKTISAQYGLVPQGLVFQLQQPGVFHETAQPQLIIRGLADGAIEFENDDVVKLKVLPVYVNMLYNRGRYLAAYGRHQAAIEAFEAAAKLNPEFKDAERAAGESRAALSKANSPGA